MQTKISLNDINKCRNQILTAVVVTLGSFGTGTVFGWSAVAIESIKIDFSSNGTGSEKKRQVDGDMISWATSLAILGAFLGGPIGGFTMDRFGRKVTVLVFSLPFLLGWATICSAHFLKPNGFFLLYLGRIITGMCAGCYLVVIPAYVKECSIDAMRGILGSCVPLMLVIGILYALIIGSFRNWFELSAYCAIPPVCLVLGALWLPETPRYLLDKNKMEKAVASYKWLNRIKDNSLAQEEVMQIFSVGQMNTSKEKSLSKLLARPVSIPIVIMVFVILFQQFGGVNTVTLYTVEIFKNAGDFIKPENATMLMGVVQVVFVLVSMFLVDVLGRKTLLVGSSLVMGICLIVLGIYFYIKEKKDGREKVIAWLPVLSIYTYMAAYGTGMGPVPWVLANELYNPDYRAESATIMTSAYWIFGFIVAKTFINLESALKTSGSFWFYGAFCLLGFIFTLFIVPETKGKSSEEILHYFSGKATPPHEEQVGEGDHRNREKIATSKSNISIVNKPSVSEGTAPEIISEGKIDEKKIVVS